MNTQSLSSMTVDTVNKSIAARSTEELKGEQQAAKLVPIEMVEPENRA